MRLLSTKLSRWKVGNLFFLLYCLFFMADTGLSNFLSEETCPELCTCINSTGVVNCDHKNLKEIPKDIPVWVKQLSLQDNKLSAHGLQRYNFSRFPDLEELDLSENKIQNLTLDLTDNQNLRKIFLDHCSLSTLPKIKTDANVTHLSLSHNSISELGDVLQNYRQLIVLDLSFNKIRQIKPDDFLHKKLTHLYLQKNRINILALIRFQGLDSIEVIDLSRNRIKNITKSCLPQPVNKQEESCSGILLTLKHLNLSQNQLSGIEGLTFSEMGALETLTLDRNKIKHLGDGAFYGPIALKTLVLDYNFLSVVKRAWLFQLSSLQTLSIAHNNMSKIEPDGWDFCKQLMHLDLSYNRLPSLTSHGFAKLTNLETLQLSHNRISVLADFAFDGLGKLKTLDLSFNQISSSIEDINGAFLGLASIRELSLRQNKIRALSASALEGLESIVTLDLCNNAVTSIQNRTFDKMNNLSKLSLISSSFLCDCQLAWFPSWLLEKQRTSEEFVYIVEGSCFHPPALKGRDILNIKSSEFICVDHPIPVLFEQPVSQTALVGTNITFQCSASATYTSNENETNIAPTATTVQEKPVTDVGNPLPNPRRLGGFPLKADSVVEPVIVPPDPSKTPPQRRDAGKKFDVKKHGMTVTWKRGQEIIQPAPGIEIKNIPRQQGAYVFMTSVLMLNGVTDSENGKYNCIISNNYGHVRSTPVELTVNEAPKFTKIPVNITVVKNGSAAIIECGATGQPSPQITWQKVGGRSFPAAKQRRLIHEHKKFRKTHQTSDESETETPDNSGMFLKPMNEAKTVEDEKFAVDADAPLKFGVVLPEDSGEYECVAQSNVGRIVAKAMLIVEYEPYFTEPVSPLSKAIVGESAVLQCMVAASPKPQIVWRFNEENLEKTTRHYMAAEKQILVIVNTSMSDAGDYSCFVSNKHGQLLGKTQLEVSKSAEGGFLGEIFGNQTQTAIIAIAVLACIILILIVWLIIFCYKKKEEEKAPSTGTDDTGLTPGLDANSYVSTDESLRKCHSSHDVHLTEDEANGALLNNSYGASHYQGSASSPDISHMQITQITTPGSLNRTPQYPQEPRFRQTPRRCQSSTTIKEPKPLLSSFSSSDNCRARDQHALCNGDLNSGRKRGNTQPIISPSRSFARKAAGADTYVAVNLKNPKQEVSIRESTSEQNSKSRRLKKTKGSVREKEQTPKTQSVSTKNENKGVCLNNRAEFNPNSHSEQIFRQPLLCHTKQNGGLVKSRNHDSAKTENAMSWRTRRKGNSTSSAETIPLGDTVAFSRKLRNSADESQPKISSSSGATEFSSSTTLTSESSQLLHHNKTPLHNYPPSGVENSRLLT